MKTLPLLKSCFLLGAAASAFLLLPATSSAAILAFDEDGALPVNQGTGFGKNWGSATGWHDGAAFGSWVDGSVAAFNDGGNMGIEMNGNRTLAGITKTTANNNFTLINLTGNILTLDPGAAIDVNQNTLAFTYGRVSGSNIVINGPGDVRFGSGDVFDTTANTISGVTLNGGNLLLAKSSVAAVGGNVIVNAGGLTFQNNSQLTGGGATNLTQNSGGIDFGGFGQEVNSVTLNGGVNGSAPSANLYITGANALTVRNVSLNANTTTHLNGAAQTVRFDATNNGTGQVSGNVIFGDGNKTFNVENGTEIADLRVIGNISQQVWATSDPGLIKTGAGALELYGTMSYQGNTVVNEGVLSLTDTSVMTFFIGANGINNGITGNGTGQLFMNGDFVFDLSAAGTTVGNSWNIADLGQFTASGFFGSFDVASFSEISTGLWERDLSGNIYQFSETTGLLTVVPEPSIVGLLMVACLALVVVLRRRSGARTV